MARKTVVLIFTLLLILVPIFNSSAFEDNDSSRTDIDTNSAFLSPPKYDKNISEMMDQVNSTNLYHHIKTLQQSGTRYIGTWGNRLAASWIREEFRSLGLESRYQNFTVGSGGLEVSNIIGIQEGVHPEKRESTIIVSGHLDSIVQSNDREDWAPGADDDASGIAATLETARILSKYNFSRTIMYCAWNAEEVGLVGSRYFVKNLDTEEYRIDAVLQYDMIGYCEDGRLDVNIHADRASKSLLDHMRDVDEIYDTPVNITPIYSSDMKASDHSSFWEMGYNATMTIEKNFNPYYHSYKDTLDKLSMEMVGSVTELAVGCTAHLGGLIKPDPISFYLLEPESSSYRRGGETMELRWFVKHESLRPDQMSVELSYSEGEHTFAIGTYQDTSSIWWDVPVLNREITLIGRALSPEMETLSRYDITFIIDSTRPEIIDYCPSDISGRIDSSINDFTFEFSEPVESETITRDNIYFIPELSYYRLEPIDDNTIRVFTYSLLDENISYSLIINNITDLAGNSIDGYNFSFTTEANEPPEADFSMNYSSDHNVVFESRCTDKEGDISNITWYFGDGSIGYGEEVTHEYKNTGTYNVTVEVTDEEGAVSNYSDTVNIERRPESDDLSIYWIILPIILMTVLLLLYKKREIY